ncbi:MAG: sulfatase [Sandaracinaceae bacterium]|nr:sulfatase [Sandaracinaceae bacterium]
MTGAEQREAQPGEAHAVADWPVRALLGGLLVSVIELGFALSGNTWSLFLGNAERDAYVGLALLTGVCASTLVFGLGVLLRRVSADPVWRGWLMGGLAFAACLVLLYLLSDGRRVRDSALRLPVVALLAGGAGVLVTKASPWLEARARGGGSVALAVLFTALSCGAAAADATLLLRLYPAFHVALAVLVVLGASLAAWQLPVRLARLRQHARFRGAVRGVTVILVLAVVATPLALQRATLAPNLAFVVADYTSVTGKLLQLALRAQSEAMPEGHAAGSSDGDAEPATQGGVETRSGLRLESRNVLLITVDALRADRIGGGRGLTPNLDRLAAESAVFSHAYTPTPHTSYALSSMLTGKYLRPVLELPNAPTEHVALPELLRRYGMRTAAFYPPAIFFVDAHRFEALRAGRFGFEYQKEMFASAHARVPQLREYLESVDAEQGPQREVFAWVHLFEPHEPYEPNPRFARGESAEQRYDGEVAAVDDAIQQLVRVFREHRPGATVVISADHGEEFGDHGGLYHGSTLYEEQVRIPLIWSTPGLVPARAIAAPVELVDIATTLLAALAIPRDARMRGDDLGPLLVHGEGGPAYAFAEVGDARMVTDGTHKAICESDTNRCQLYDLGADPEERRNLAGEDPVTLLRLREELGRFVGSIPRVEALALVGQQGWPEALARAELGDATAAPELVPLLGDQRSAVRAAAARLLGRLRHAPALGTLVRLRDQDADVEVRDEAALASLALGDASSADAVRAMAARDGVTLPLQRRAALALGERGDASLARVLDTWAADEGAGEDARSHVIELLGTLRYAGSVPTLVALLEDVRLGPAAALALGAIGDRRAIAPLRQRLRGERYLSARAAEAAALVQLGDRAVASEIMRFLGMEQPLPGGVELLVRLGTLARPSGRGLRLSSSPQALEGAWSCTAETCAAPNGGRVNLPPSGAPRGEVQVVCAVDSPAGGSVQLGGSAQPVRAGRAQVAVRVTGPLLALAIETSPDLTLSACVVVPARPELPPPPPEPYEADESAAGADADAGVAPTAER